jgi:hypothetical protein
MSERLRSSSSSQQQQQGSKYCALLSALCCCMRVALEVLSSSVSVYRQMVLSKLDESSG